jgi:hypothetical protein
VAPVVQPLPTIVPFKTIAIPEMETPVTLTRTLAEDIDLSWRVGVDLPGRPPTRTSPTILIVAFPLPFTMPIVRPNTNGSIAVPLRVVECYSRIGIGTCYRV